MCDINVNVHIHVQEKRREMRKGGGFKENKISVVNVHALTAFRCVYAMTLIALSPPPPPPPPHGA